MINNNIRARNPEEFPADYSITSTFAPLRGDVRQQADRGVFNRGYRRLQFICF